MKKVLVTARNFSNLDRQAVGMLEAAGFLVQEYADALQSSPEDLIRAGRDAEAVIAGVEPYSGYMLKNLPNLKIIARRGAGVDSIDMAAAKALNITVTRTEGLVGSAVAELIMAYILEGARKLTLHSNAMKQGIWSRVLADGVYGKTLGLVGFGSIARETALRAQAFGIRVLCFYRHRDREAEENYHAEFCDLPNLAAESDYLSLNVPLTEETRGMIDRTIFNLMKPSALLINTARSAIVNKEDLISALQEKRIAGACVDVYDYEPCVDSPLLSCDNVVLTPHVGTFTRDTFTAMNNRCAEQVIEFFRQK